MFGWRAMLSVLLAVAVTVVVLVLVSLRDIIMNIFFRRFDRIFITYMFDDALSKIFALFFGWGLVAGTCSIASWMSSIAKHLPAVAWSSSPALRHVGLVFIFLEIHQAPEITNWNLGSMVCKPGYVSDLLMGYINIINHVIYSLGLLNSWNMVAEGHSEGGLLQNGRGDVKTPTDVQGRRFFMKC